MADSLLGKHQLEKALYDEKKEISSGRLKDENPLDTSLEFRKFCEACRRGDLRVCQEQIGKGININARDEYDYTPLILASLCGHYEVAQMLLEQGALCERDTFQGERCLYNALNDRIRNLLLQYDYSKSSDPLQPLAAHVTSLLTRDTPKTADITVEAGSEKFELHKFVLSTRSPYFARKLAVAPETTTWKLANAIPAQSFETCIRYLYLAEVGADLGEDEDAKVILTGIDKLSRQLEIQQLFQDLLASGDRRQARQRRTDEVQRSRDQLSNWFLDNVLKHRTTVETEKVNGVKWDRDNSIFADVLLRADEDDQEDEDETAEAKAARPERRTEGALDGIPVGHFQKQASRSTSRARRPRQSVLFPCHRAMLLRSEVFATMFASPFREGQESRHLQIVPVDCSPEVLEIILTFMYTESADFPLGIALDVLNAADMLFIEKLKQRAALLISTLGAGASVVEANNPRGETEAEDLLDIYDVVRAGWDTRVHRLEEFGARYIAYRLERYIDEPEFKELVKESANRIKARQETDTVELIDDIRYYLSERFRLRFEDTGFDETFDETPADQLADDLKELDIEQEIGAVDAGNMQGEEGQMVIRTLDGEIAGDEFAQDALNYQILLGKIDTLMENLGLDG
ncbi:Putative ankyrin repeat and BTB/POZ domain-containing protein [Septoria linicola]|uniref:Ankyrin repeat and BTB/POZ domain-containing protein n=1 Tax=Septoria linicola TaxID=215465 RepID=A0A9Q9EFG9_9PEZI|nr:Putative ankyrin repeat and BTB/POZ domain-containing protein [Septoria linicola]